MGHSYKSDTVECTYLSDLTGIEGETLIGKTVARVEASEYELILTFTDGSRLKVEGHTYDGCALSTAVVDD